MLSKPTRSSQDGGRGQGEKVSSRAHTPSAHRRRVRARARTSNQLISDRIDFGYAEIHTEGRTFAGCHRPQMDETWS